MTVEELISKLKQFPQDAIVLRYDNEYFHEETGIEEVYIRNGKVELQ